ncbi:MAG: polysaccharide biosynthesis/export family protein [Gemmatimonadota bacterium]
MKAIWAVACSVLAIGIVSGPFAGCAAAPVAPKETAASAPKGGANGSGAPVLSGPQYRIGAEDVLHVSVWDNKDLTLDVVVRPDGKISFPLIQDVQAEGLTAAQLGDVIHQKLLPFIKDPQVSVIVTQINAPKIYVLGNVAKPGAFPLRSDTSVLQALSLAGGFTQFASPRSIRLVRGLGTKQEVRKINYYNLVEGAGEGNYLLMPGDTIWVP